MAQPLPKEFQPYRKLQAATEAELRRILEATAKAMERRIASLPVGVGGQVRAAQLRVTLAAVNALMRQMWVGRINPLLERAINDSLQASENAIEALERVAYAGLSEQAAETLVAGLRAAGASGLKSDAARRARALSTRVYRQRALDDGRVEQIIRQGLISGLSAKELAKDIHQYVSPTAPGGASYAAMRLARTEINNAFHERQIEGAKRPGVRAVKWNLSGSHRVPDLCNVYAGHNGSGEWPVDEIPDKPHPNCFCYLTYLMMSSDDFKKSLEAGDFDAEIDRRTKANLAELGQPVGEDSPAPGVRVPSNDTIERAVHSGVRSSEKLSGGVSAETSKVRFNDGTLGVRKVVHHSTAKDQQDAEELVPMLARMMGLKAPQVTRIDKETSVQQFLPGKVAIDGIPFKSADGKKILSATARVKPWSDSDQGWLVGLLDQTTGNQDRNDGNWLIETDDDGGVVEGGNLTVIDHGLAYSLRDWRTKHHDHKALDEPYIFRVRDQFSRKFTDAQGNQKNIDVHPEDLDAMSAMLLALKPEYEERGRLDWWEFSRMQIDALRPFAKGKKRRIQ